MKPDQERTMTQQPRTHRTVSNRRPGRRGHSWMMIACCIPMLVIAVALVGTGVVSVGFLFAAVGCGAMMFFMMRGMDHGGGSSSETPDRSTHSGHGQ